MRSVSAARSAAMILAVVAGMGCGTKPPPVRQKVTVTVATAERAPAPYVVTANGLVEAMQSVAVQSQIQGVLSTVRFREGDEVQAGDVLFEIDPRPFRAALDQAKAVLARDIAQADNARRDADRYASLVQKDFVTRSQADQAQANAVAQQAVVKADSAAVANAQFNFDNATIRAPIGGKTGNLFVRQGNLVRPGSVPPLVVINQIHPILARFAVPDRELARVQKFAREHPLKAVATTAMGGSGVTGTLNFIDNGVDSTTGTVTLKARFENADNALWPGQFVSVALELFVEPDAILVPSPAVQPAQDGGQFVFVVDRDGKVRTVTVVAGRIIGDRTVIEQGLAAGDRVVTDGQSRITPGASVDIRTADQKALQSVGNAADSPAAGVPGKAAVADGAAGGKPTGKADGKAGGKSVASPKAP